MVMEMETETGVADGREWENRERDKVELAMVEVVETVERGELMEAMEMVEMEVAEQRTLEVLSEETVTAKFVDVLIS